MSSSTSLFSVPIERFSSTTQNHLQDEITHFNPQNIQSAFSSYLSAKISSSVHYHPLNKSISYFPSAESFSMDSSQPVPKLGCIILAGGQGTRLKWDKPKGTYPIGPYSKKSLFQIFAESLCAATEFYQTPIPLAVMVSKENADETIDYFRENNNFGLKEEQLSFFTQGSLPILSQEGKLLIDSKEKLLTGPTGNGEVLKDFYESGLWKKWNALGIRGIQIFPVDNPLILPYDAQTLALYQKNEVAPSLVIRVVERQDAKEPIGTFAQNDRGQLCVVEYSEISSEQAAARDLETGKLLFRWGYIGLVTFSMEFARLAAEEYTSQMPWHGAFKKYTALQSQANQITSSEIAGIKLEKFIFDLFPFVDKSNAIHLIATERSEWFAPLKNYSGADSPDTVRKAMCAADRRQLEKLLECSLPADIRIELAGSYYYPSSKLLQKLSSLPSISSGYLSA